MKSSRPTDRSGKEASVTGVAGDAELKSSMRCWAEAAVSLTRVTPRTSSPTAGPGGSLDTPPSVEDSLPMMRLTRRQFVGGAALAPLAFSSAGRALADLSRLGGGDHKLRLVYTNDFHSAFDPIPGYWLPGSPKLGGAAHFATLVERERAAAPTSFLLDSGDMFTGTLSLLTKGEALLEMMIAMGYDAWGVGNHEFDYGWENFEAQQSRVGFPILCANVRYRQTEGAHPIRFCQPHAILERNGVRIGVVSVMGARAAKFTIMPSKISGLEFVDPVAEAAAQVALLRPAVDVVVVLGHQGLPGPMQTDAENDPSVQRPLDEDLAFCGAIPGIDVYIAAHSHHGIETPIVHPQTGTLLVQSYGYGTRVGVLDLEVKDGRVTTHRGELKKVWSDELPAHPAVAERLAYYRSRLKDEIGPDVGRATARFIRKYNNESSLGSFVTDVMRARAASDVAITNAGGLRADLPEGPLHRGHVLDALPFLNTLVTLEMRGSDLRRAVAHGLSLAAGCCQVSGVTARWDPRRPAEERLVALEVGGAAVVAERTYRVSTNSFLAEGGDGYESFRSGRKVAEDALLSDCVLDHLRRVGTITPPPPGRLATA